VAVGRDPERALEVVAGFDAETLTAITLHVAKIAGTLAQVAAQMAAEAVARGVDASPVQTEPTAPDGVLDIVYRSMEAEEG
jgi:hypothetical protein